MRAPSSLVCVVVALGLQAGVARAGDLELGPDGLPVGLVWLPLTTEQRGDLKADSLFVRLTPAQQDVVERTQGIRARWMVATPLSALLADCTCGAQNVAVLEQVRIGVIPGFVSLAMSSEEAGVLRATQASERATAPSLTWVPPHRGPLGALLHSADVAALTTALAAPVRPFALAPQLPAGWRPARVDTGGPGLWGPSAAEALLDQFPPRLVDVRIELVQRPVAWPGTGAVLREGDEVTLLVPQAQDHEADGQFAAWLVLRYRAGRLLQAVLVDQRGAGQTWGLAWRSETPALSWSEWWFER